MSILFTTGATVTFCDLVDKVASPKFLEFLVSVGFSKITLQYGNETSANGANLSKEYFNNCLAKETTIDTLNLSIANATNDKSVISFTNTSLEFRVFAFSDDIASFVSSADLVVSHAGTGSILDTLRLHKPLIVVTNDSLMDSHQSDIASRFEAEGYLTKVAGSSLGDGSLERAINQFQNGALSFKPLPNPPKGVLERIIAEEVDKT